MERMAFGHKRLSILDLTDAACQPMESPDKRYVIVYNGELYNFADLKQELSPYPFKTAGDTEIVLAAFAHWGTDAFSRFNGIFALAIYDRHTRRTILARDPAGIKPLYYVHSGDVFAFSSEIKALLETGIAPRLDLEAFDAYLRLLYVPGPKTAFKGVRKLPPGMFGVFDRDSFTIRSYLKEETDATFATFREAKEATRHIVDEAVRRQLISDRPLGVYLSGGIDSSVILDAASRARPGIDTFSVGFELASGEEVGKFNADSEIASRTARAYGATHHSFVIAPDEILPALTSAIYHLDEPISNPTIIPMYLLSGRVKEAGIDVVLAGDGGDELFGGYDRHRWSRRADVWQSLPSVFRRAASRVVPRLAKLEDVPGIERYARFHFQKEKCIQQVTGEAYRPGDVLREEFAHAHIRVGRDPLEWFLRADRSSWLVDESLAKADKLSMAHGLEVRVPFLDREVVRLSERIPSAYKTDVMRTKIVLKEAFRKRLPPYLFAQPKRGWHSPGAKWLRYPHIETFAREALSPGFHEGTDDLFDWEEVGRMLEDHVSGRRYNLTMVWAILTFRTWAQTFKITV